MCLTVRKQHFWSVTVFARCEAAGAQQLLHVTSTKVSLWIKRRQLLTLACLLILWLYACLSWTFPICRLLGFMGAWLLKNIFQPQTLKAAASSKLRICSYFRFAPKALVAGSEREAFCLHSTRAQLRVMLLEHHLWFFKAKSTRVGPSMLHQSITQILKSPATLIRMTLIAKTNVDHPKEGLVHLILSKKKHRGYKSSSKTWISWSLSLFLQCILCTWLLRITGGILISKKLVSTGEATKQAHQRMFI